LRDTTAFKPWRASLEFKNKQAEIEFHEDFERRQLQFEYSKNKKLQDRKKVIDNNVYSLGSKFKFIRFVLKNNLNDPSENN
jgi:hypothetical protein